MKKLDPVVDRVFTDQDTKLFKFKAMVGLVHKEYGDDIISVTDVAVYDGNPYLSSKKARLLGYANLSASGKYVLAEVAMDYSSPERLLIETKSQKLYLHIMPGTHAIDTVVFITDEKPSPYSIPIGEPVL